MRLLSTLFSAMCLSASAIAGTLEDIVSRGVVTCGVEDANPGFFVSASGGRQGLAVDLCKIVAEVMLGRREAVAFMVLGAEEAPAALQAEEVDVLLLARSWTFADEAEQGLLLVQPLLSNVTSGQVFGPVVRQGDDSWFLALRWLLNTLQRADGKVWSESHGAAGERLGFRPGWLAEKDFTSNSYGELLNSHLRAMPGADWQVVPSPAGTVQ